MIRNIKIYDADYTEAALIIQVAMSSGFKRIWWRLRLIIHRKLK